VLVFLKNMNSPTITIFTCSYNKPQYVLEAINSILDQTFTDFEYIIIENSDDGKTRKIVHSVKDKRIRIIDVDLDERRRNKNYAESLLKNKFFFEAKGKYLTSLADDDLLLPNCFEEHLKLFKKTSQAANYHAYKIVYSDPDIPEEVVPATCVFGPEASPLLKTDGGAVMFQKTLLQKIPQPLFKCNWFDAHISDGLFLNKISKAFKIYPINKILHIKRVTEISTHTFVDGSGIRKFFRPKRGWNHPFLNISNEHIRKNKA
jgi:glycosyltransferase involved in cell wall biosynthesis